MNYKIIINNNVIHPPFRQCMIHCLFYIYIVGNILKEYIKLVLEEIGRDFHTRDNDPFTWEDYEGINLETYVTSDGEWVGKVNVVDFPSLSTSERKFADYHSVQFWGREEAEKIKRKLLNL